MQFAKPKIRPQFEEWSQRFRICCGFWSNNNMSGINTLRPDPGSTHKTKRIGRGPGTGHGKTAGRGNKGMWSRSGSSQKRGFEGGQMPLHRRMPKRGFTNAPFKKEFSTVNVSDLVKFEKGSKIGPQELLAAGVLRKLEKNGLRVLGDGQ